jgi:uncharacterized repeat protein (TIGR02543 family)
MNAGIGKSSGAAGRRFGGVVKVLALAAVAALSLSAQAATKKIGKYIWTYKTVKGGVQIGDGTGVALVPCCSTSPSGTVTVPSKIGKYAVKAIADKAFVNCDAITVVKIPKGVTSIGAFAFYGCSSLQSASLPTTVKSIGDFAFAECSSLRTASIPKGVKKISQGAFTSCTNLVKVTLPTTVTSIGMGAFAGSASLRSISIPSSVKSIEGYAFQNGGLTSLSIPGSVKTIGQYAFCNCASLQYANLLPGVTNISAGAFQNCEVLESVFLPHSLTEIGTSAFHLSLTAGDREIRYEDIEDKDSLKTMLTNSGYSGVNNLLFCLYCKLTIKPNNKKYGTAGVMAGTALKASYWDYAENGITIQAKPKKGKVFAGWFQDKACKTPIEDSDILDGDYRMAKIPIVMPTEHSTYYAKFITKAADKKALKFNAATKKLAKTTTKLTPESCNPLKITASSASRLTYSAKGLPTGLSIDDETGQIYGSPRKPGTFTVTITVKSAGGSKITQKIKLTVEADRDAWGAYEGYAQPSAKAGDPPAKLTFSVNKYGKVTGKVNWKDKAYSFTSQCSYSVPGITQFSPSIKIGKTTFKPGVVTVNLRDIGGTDTVFADSATGRAFCAYKKAMIVAVDGPLEGLMDVKDTTLTEANDDSGLTPVPVSLNIKFNNGDMALVAGTVNGKPVNFSTQLCLKQGGYNGAFALYDMVAPIVLYKYGYYRALWLTIKDNKGDISVEVKSLRDIGEMR